MSKLRSPRLIRAIGSALPVLVCLSFLVSLNDAAADDFAPRCWDAAPGLSDVQDFEFDSGNKRAVWQNDPVFASNGTLSRRGWVSVAPIDDDGNIILSDLIECDECSAAPMALTLGGPEFVSVGGQNSIYFTSMSEDERTVRLGKLTEDAAGDWQLSFLPRSDGMVMLAPGGNPAASTPTVYSRRVAGDFTNTGAGSINNRFQRIDWTWRYDDSNPVDITMDPGPFQKEGSFGSNGFFTGRFFPDGSKLAYAAGVKRTWLDVLLNRTRFVPALYDFAANTSVPLIDDPRKQPDLAESTWPTVFQAPELGGKTVLVGVVKNRPETSNAIVLWRQNPQGAWEEWTRIEPVDPNYPCLWHPEGFSVNGRSYVTFESFRPLACAFNNVVIPTASVMAVASVDPGIPAGERVRRVVSEERNPATVSSKTDVEVAVIKDSVSQAEKARIYYRDYPGLPLFPPSAFMVCDPDLP